MFQLLRKRKKKKTLNGKAVESLMVFFGDIYKALCVEMKKGHVSNVRCIEE